ncbi:PREDICTED: biogenesis of lysosome-related organelles complex 1 subunit 5 [Papilio xuthus]|uniref:Biogenesis of lysosome-related organelles complex 1 subunit 5 n=2 Tax=Papilio xuthus TaxID=66420 RepID=A0AAJ7EB34_PAPXU|nr:PREDICTED: biogenesis of lysosome-related organelles complex 1 subunit 5 [Papilio xuthus]
MSELSREIGEIWTRLFDHRPFLNGEITYMLKEFEEKRGDRDVESLFSMLENFTDVRDTHIEKLTKTGGLVLPLLLRKIEQTRELAAEAEKTCIDLEEIYKQKQAVNREKRRKEWDCFIDDMNFNCQRIDNTFEEKEEELRDLYTDLNHKLNINSSK